MPKSTKSTKSENVEVTPKSHFEALLFSKENVMTPERVTRREGKVSRAFDSVVAGIEEQIDDMQDVLVALETTVAKDDVKVIKDLLKKRIELADLNKLLAEAVAAKAEFFAAK